MAELPGEGGLSIPECARLVQTNSTAAARGARRIPMPAHTAFPLEGGRAGPGWPRRGINAVAQRPSYRRGHENRLLELLLIAIRARTAAIDDEEATRGAECK